MRTMMAATSDDVDGVNADDGDDDDDNDDCLQTAKSNTHGQTCTRIKQVHQASRPLHRSAALVLHPRSLLPRGGGTGPRLAFRPSARPPVARPPENTHREHGMV